MVWCWLTVVVLAGCGEVWLAVVWCCVGWPDVVVVLAGCDVVLVGCGVVLAGLLWCWLAVVWCG